MGVRSIPVRSSGLSGAHVSVRIGFSILVLGSERTQPIPTTTMGEQEWIVDDHKGNTNQMTHRANDAQGVPRDIGVLKFAPVLLSFRKISVAPLPGTSLPSVVSIALHRVRVFSCAPFVLVQECPF